MYLFTEFKTVTPRLLAWTLGCAWFTSSLQAVSPAPDGGYPNGNTAEGDNALFSLDTSLGTNNTALGSDALLSETNEGFNTAVGSQAMLSSTTGFSNTAIGYQALMSATSPSGDTAVGFQALQTETTGSSNTAIGTLAMFFNQSGAVNTAVGYAALQDNTIGNYNTAVGLNALLNNTEGFLNTGLGAVALNANTIGSSNTAIGYFALVNNTTGNSNIAIGDSAGLNLTTGSNNIDIGNKGVAGESNTIRIGKKGTQTTTMIAGINGATVAGGIAVLIGSNGRLGTTTSSARFKDAIKPMDKASEAILALKPVTFRYRHELDPKGIPQFGLVAEDVEKVNPDLVARDDEGKPYTVRYDAVNAMLLNEFLKEHRKVEEQDATICQLKSTVAQQHKDFEAAVAELKGQIQKVNAQLELNKAAPRTVQTSP